MLYSRESDTIILYSNFYLMQKTFYHFLMMLCFMIAFNFLYLIGLFAAVYYNVVSRYTVDHYLSLALSPYVFFTVSIIAGIVGYRFAKKWYKIIYIDKVLYFGDKKKHHK